jgi:hypothetical protein
MFDPRAVAQALGGNVTAAPFQIVIEPTAYFLTHRKPPVSGISARGRRNVPPISAHTIFARVVGSSCGLSGQRQSPPPIRFSGTFPKPGRRDFGGCSPLNLLDDLRGFVE